jgi:hypothetical protein
MLENEPDYKSCLKNKPTDCIRVDGAGDEGPIHAEVQFSWTERHLEQEKVCTLVTTRSSGSSYLNRVELQNGCLAVAHSNIFIPSTIHSSNFVRSGSIDYDRLEQNLESATDVYISKCNIDDCPKAALRLLKGSRSCKKLPEQTASSHHIPFWYGKGKRGINERKSDSF